MTTPDAVTEALRNIREKASQGMSHGLTADAICEDILRLADAALAQAADVQEPGEWVMVPRQMTTDMMGAYHHAKRVESYLPPIWAAILAAAPFPPSEAVEARRLALDFQARVQNVHGPLFDGDPTDVPERRDRFFEEATETVQAFGMTEEDAIALVRYTFSRPVGDPKLEVGSAALTLASLCVEAGIDMMECAEADLAKLQRPETIARIRAKRLTRHGRGSLPGLSPERALTQKDKADE